MFKQTKLIRTHTHTHYIWESGVKAWVKLSQWLNSPLLMIIQADDFINKTYLHQLTYIVCKKWLRTVARSFWVIPFSWRPCWMTLPTSSVTLSWCSSSVSRSSLAVFLVTTCCLFCPAVPGFKNTQWKKIVKHPTNFTERKWHLFKITCNWWRLTLCSHY